MVLRRPCSSPDKHQGAGDEPPDQGGRYPNGLVGSWHPRRPNKLELYATRTRADRPAGVGPQGPLG
jgi:hypothetical protein